MTIYVDGEAVHRLLDYPGLVEALRRAHQGQTPMLQTMLSEAPSGSGDRFLTLLGWADDVVALKAVGIFPKNLARTPPEPSVQGIVTLFDGDTGRPLVVGDGAALTFRKTAADSALGAAFLARPDAETLLVVGAGGMAPHVAMAHVGVRPSIRRVRIWNRTPARASELAETLQLPGVAVGTAADLDAAVAEADIISAVTMAEKPVIKGALLKPGTHLDLVGSYLPTMREADDEAIRRSRVFVDRRRRDTHAGEILDPIARGVITWDDIAGDLFELCQGRSPGRTSPKDITLFKNQGGGHLDLFTMRHLRDRVRETGYGKPQGG